jgi:hypothetical protein
VAEGIVDLFESIQIQIQQRERALVATRAGYGLLQQMLELHAIRHFGEGIVARQIADAPFRALALGDIARDINVALELRVFRRDRGTRHGDGNGLTAGRAQHGLARFGCRVGQIEGIAVCFVNEAD